MLEQILPPEVAVCATRGEIEDAPLFPVEERALGRAVEKRRREFVTARACARRALAELGEPAQAIPSGERGEPLWPDGLVGSITHCSGYRACALARRELVVTIGIDAEVDEPLPEGLLGDIARAEERPRLALLARQRPEVSWDRLLFCVKESVYKAWFPLAGRWLGFEDASVEIDAEGGFAAKLLVAGPQLGREELRGFSGRWLASEGLLAAAVALPAVDGTAP